MTVMVQKVFALRVCNNTAPDLNLKKDHISAKEFPRR
jgi:hypothetical protein